MISLITGLPGMGKTSLMVHMLMTRSDLQNRPLYVDGIAELKLPTQPIPDGETMETWHLWAPPGSVLVIDEAQRIFRPRPSGAKVPDFVQELETHRHKGIDFFILTQHPRLLDINLRSLIGEHRNISRTLLGFKRLSYWQRCANPESRADIAEAKQSIFTPKKSVFGMYKSAEEHTVVKGKLSSYIYIFPVAVGAVVYFSYSLKSSYERKTASPQNVAVSEPQLSASSVSDSYAYTPPPAASVPIEQPPSVAPLSASDFVPTVPDQPWSAPIYNNLNRNVQSMPYPVACVKNGNKCTCYTDQATVIEGLSKKACLSFIKNGLYNPYITKEQALPESN